MKRKVFLVGTLLLAPLVGMFVAAREAASWRPVRVGVSPKAYSLSVSRGGWIQTQTANSAVFQRDGQVLKEGGADSAFLSPDETLVALGNVQSGTLRILRLKDEKQIQVWRHLPSEFGAGLCAGRFENNNRVFVGVFPSSVWHFDVASGKVLSQAKLPVPSRTSGNGLMTYGVSFLKNGDLYYFDGEEALVVDSQTGIPKRKEKLGILSPDESLIIDWNFNVYRRKVKDFRTGKDLWNAVSHIDPVFSPDSRSLLVVQDGQMRLLDTRTGEPTQDLNIVPADSYAFSPDGNALYSLQHDGQILRWRLR